MRVRKVVRVEGEKKLSLRPFQVPPLSASGVLGPPQTTKSSTSIKTGLAGRSTVDGSGLNAFGTVRTFWSDLTTIKSLSDKDQIQLAFYEDNTLTSIHPKWWSESVTDYHDDQNPGKQWNSLITYSLSPNGYAWVDAVNAFGSACQKYQPEHGRIFK